MSERAGDDTGASDSDGLLGDTNRRMAAGAGWMTAFTLVDRFRGLLSMLVLARLLVPADFGIVAMASTLIAAMVLLTSFNFETVLIHKAAPEESHFDSAWTMTVIASVVATVLLCLLAAPIARFYREPAVEQIVYWLAIGFLVKGFENIRVVWFRKNLQFHKEFVLRVAPRLLSLIVTVSLAFAWRSYWVLVVGMVFSNVVSVLLSYLMKPALPRFCVSKAAELFRYSRWLLINNFIHYGRNQSSYLIVGRLAGPEQLGAFTIAQELATLPTTQLTAPINRAVFPGYAKLAHDLSLLRRSHLSVSGMIATITLPAAMGISAVASLMIPAILGPNWGAAVPIVELMAIYGGILSLMTNTGSIFNARGKPYYVTAIGAVQVSILIPAAIYLCYQMGPIGVAWAYVGMAVITGLPIIYVTLREIENTMGAYLGVVVRPVLASGVMYFVTTTWISSTSSGIPVIDLLSSIVVGILSYAVALACLWLIAGRPGGSEATIMAYVAGLRHRPML